MGLMSDMLLGLWFTHKLMSLNMWPHQLGTVGLAMDIKLGTCFNSLWNYAHSYEMSAINSTAF